MSQHIVVSFVSQGRRGRVDVQIEPNADPERTGHDQVAVGYDRDRFLDYPVIKASVEYDGEGYRAVFGWVQFVTHHYADGSPPVTQLDTWPSLQSVFLMIAMGFLPTFFDAPANPDHPDMRWLAHTYLLRFSLREPRALVALAGIGWGYDLAGGRPTIFTPTELRASDWVTNSADESSLDDWQLDNEMQSSPTHSVP